MSNAEFRVNDSWFNYRQCHCNTIRTKGFYIVNIRVGGKTIEKEEMVCPEHGKCPCIERYKGEDITNNTYSRDEDYYGYYTFNKPTTESPSHYSKGVRFNTFGVYGNELKINVGGHSFTKTSKNNYKVEEIIDDLANNVHKDKEKIRVEIYKLHTALERMKRPGVYKVV